MSIPSSISDDLPMPLICVKRNNLEIIWANHFAQEWFGKSLKSLKRRSLEDLFEPSEMVIEACHKVNKNSSLVRLHEVSLSGNDVSDIGDIIVFSSDGDIVILLNLHVKPLSRTDVGNVAMTAMGRMLAHEVKNPLAGIHGAAQLLRQDITSEEGLSLVDLIESEIQRIRRLADRMDRLGDHDPVKTETINLHEILRQARRVMSPAIRGQITIREKYDPSLPPTQGDPDTLLQAVINLIKNAVEAMEESGQGDEIVLETAFWTGIKRRYSEGNLRQQLPIIVTVSDNGPGFTEDMKDRLFQPFISSKPTGQGLGLALVSKVAKAHGGIVDAFCEDGRTEFKLMLPLTHADDKESEDT